VVFSLKRRAIYILATGIIRLESFQESKPNSSFQAVFVHRKLLDAQLEQQYDYPCKPSDFSAFFGVFLACFISDVSAVQFRPPLLKREDCELRQLRLHANGSGCGRKHQVMTYSYANPPVSRAASEKTLPSYLQHKPTDQTYVRLPDSNGGQRPLCLGAYNSPESRGKLYLPPERPRLGCWKCCGLLYCSKYGRWGGSVDRKECGQRQCRECSKSRMTFARSSPNRSAGK